MKKILIVEDNEDNMDLLESFLEDDFELLGAVNGEMALQMAINIEPDLILLDISLPVMDGTEVITEIRKNKQIMDIPIIALTAHAMVGDKKRLMQFGFDDYLSKPILDDTKLIKMINNLMK